MKNLFMTLALGLFCLNSGASTYRLTQAGIFNGTQLEQLTEPLKFEQLSGYLTGDAFPNYQGHVAYTLNDPQIGHIYSADWSWINNDLLASNISCSNTGIEDACSFAAGSQSIGSTFILIDQGDLVISRYTPKGYEDFRFSPIPIPAAAYLFTSALIPLVLSSKKRKRRVEA